MRKIVYPGIAMIGVTYAFARFSYGLFLPEISSTIGLTESTAGIAGSAAYAAYTLALLTAPFLIQKYGQYRVIQFAGISAVLGMSGMSVSQNFLTITISTLIAGLGSGWASPAFSSVVNATLKPESRDRANTLINSGTSFGILISGPIVLLFAEQWKASYALFAAIALMVFIWNTKFIPSQNLQIKKTSNHIPWKLAIKEAKYLISASLLIGLSSSVYWTFSRSYLTSIHHMSTNESLFFWILMGASGVLGGITGGIINKIGLSLSYRLTLLSMVVSITIITIPQMIIIYFSAIIFGISYIFITGLMIVWATRVFKIQPSAGVSVAFLSLGVGQSIGSSMAGGVIEYTSYTLSFLVFALIGTIGLVIPVRSR